MERISKAGHFCIPLPSVYEKFLHILILPEAMICYCTAPIWRRGRKDQSWKWPQMGAFFPHQPRFSDGKKVLNICVYIQMMPWKSSLSSSFSVIAIMIALSPMLVLHCGKLLLPSLFPRQINHQFLSFTAIVSRWSDDLTMMPTTLMHWAHGVFLGAFSSKDEFSEKFKTAFDPSPSFLENHIAISLQFHVHHSWKIESYINHCYLNLNNELSYVENWGRSWHWQDRQIGSGIKVVFAQQTSIGNNAFSKEPLFQFGWNIFFCSIGPWILTIPTIANSGKIVDRKCIVQTIGVKWVFILSLK